MNGYFRQQNRLYDQNISLYLSGKGKYDHPSMDLEFLCNLQQRKITFTPFQKT